jgi:hypothetical protein
MAPYATYAQQRTAVSLLLGCKRPAWTLQRIGWCESAERTAGFNNQRNVSERPESWRLASFETILADAAILSLIDQHSALNWWRYDQFQLAQIHPFNEWRESHYAFLHSG